MTCQKQPRKKARLSHHQARRTRWRRVQRKKKRKKNPPHHRRITWSKTTPARKGNSEHQREKLHQGLCKAESSLANQTHTEKIGLVAFLHACTLLNVGFPACQCSRQRADRRTLKTWCFLSDLRPLLSKTIWGSGNESIPGNSVDRKGASRSGQVGHERGTPVAIFAGKEVDRSCREKCER